MHVVVCFFFLQAEDGIRDLVRSRGLGDVYKRQVPNPAVQITLSDLSANLDAAQVAKVQQILESEHLLSLIHI